MLENKEILLFFVGSFVSLFSIVNPLMAIPVFVTLTAKDTADHRNNIARRAGIYILSILLVFFIAGDLILNFFGISLEGLRIAGGLMIMNNAFEMLMKKERLEPTEQKESVEKEDIAFSPLAMPMQSGPGSIAVIIGMTSDAHLAANPYLYYPLIIFVICLVAFCAFLLMRFSHIVTKRISTTSLKAFSRIMGFIILCVGVQYIINGIMPLVKKALGN